LKEKAMTDMRKRRRAVPARGARGTTKATGARRRPRWFLGVWTVLTALVSGVLLLWVEYRSGLFVRPEPPPGPEVPRATPEETAQLRALLEETTRALAEARRQLAHAELARAQAEQARQAESVRRAADDALTREAADARRQLREVSETLHAELTRLRTAHDDARKEAREMAARLRAAEERLADLQTRHGGELARAREEAAKAREEAAQARKEAEQAAQEKAEALASAERLESQARVDRAVARSVSYLPGPDPGPVQQPRRPYPVDQRPNSSGYYGWR
jgi:DNA repair exonuclease SbcCD ATPase subunit